MDSFSDAQLFAWIEHLEHCPSCRARLGELPVDAIYQYVLDRALTQALEAVPCIEQERNSAPLQLAELLRLSPSERVAAVVREARFKTYSLVSYILGRSESAVLNNPHLALEMVRLAHSISIQVDPWTCGGAEALADLQAYALASEGNAHRVCGEMGAAIGTFTQARAVQERGGIDPDLSGRIDLMESSLRRDLRQLQDSLNLLDRATETFLILEDHELWLRTQINRANALIVQGEFDPACDLLNEILPKTEDPRIIFLIGHNLASALVSAGRYPEASRFFEESRELSLQVPDQLSANRRRWLEGAIAGGLGQQERAEWLLREAGANLAECGYAFDAALVRLDLCRLQSRQGAEPVC